MSSSFSKKRIRIEVTLGEGTFDGEHTTRVIEGLETAVSIEKPGLPDKAKAEADIANLSYDDMAQLTMLSFKPLTLHKNTIRIFAGEVGSGGSDGESFSAGALSLAFAGELTAAFADFSRAPTAVMHMEAQSGGYAALMAGGPVAAAGEVPAEKLIAQFAAEMGYSFKNEGVTASVRDAYFSGSPLEKAMAAAEQVGAQIILDDAQIILLPYASPRGGSGAAVLLTPETGLLGYPAFTSEGISLSCLYNPNLELGGAVQVESSVPGASGLWKISKLTHDLLASSVSIGPWTSSIEASPYD